jgi:hypothetical protein
MEQKGGVPAEVIPEAAGPSQPLISALVRQSRSDGPYT